MSASPFTQEDLTTLQTMMSTGALVMGTSDHPALYEIYASVCHKLGRPQVIVATDHGRASVSVRVECHSMRPEITKDQRDKVYAALKCYGEVRSLSIPAQDNLVRSNTDWGVHEIPDTEAPALLGELLEILGVLPAHQQTAD